MPISETIPGPQWATRDDVRDMGRAIQDQIDRRFHEQRDRGDERHNDNVERMDQIVAECRKTNGRVTRLETLFSTLDDEFKAIRKRWHDFRDSIQSKVQSKNDHDTGENRKLTMRDVYMFAGGAGILWAVLKAFKLI